MSPDNTEIILYFASIKNVQKKVGRKNEEAEIYCGTAIIYLFPFMSPLCLCG